MIVARLNKPQADEMDGLKAFDLFFQCPTRAMFLLPGRSPQLTRRVNHSAESNGQKRVTMIARSKILKNVIKWCQTPIIQLKISAKILSEC
jgi:hypothetical protein